MIDSLYIGATGLIGHQTSVDTVANNLTNMNTTAFKKARVSFRDHYYREVGAAGSAQAAVEATSTLHNQLMPSGLAVAGIDRVFSEGEYKRTENALDFAIRGTGFFEITLPDGSSAYTRTGELRISPDNLLMTAEGYPLSQDIEVPEGATELNVDAAGVIRVRAAGESNYQEIAQLELAQFTHAAGLKPLGGGVYVATEASGEARLGKPGEEGLGMIAQGFLETSNVVLSDELVNLMMAQRGYEASAKVIQASDEILGIVNNLRR